MIALNDAAWRILGNWMLVAFAASYLASLALFVRLHPRTLLEWATTLKVAGVAAVGVNGVLVIFFGIGTDQPLRVVVFTFATICCWLFTVLAYREWLRRRS